MKTILLLIAIVFASFGSYAQTWQWTHPEPNGVATTPNSYTDASEDDYAHDVEIDSLGNVYVLGDFYDSLYLNNIYKTRGDGSYLAKYDSTGKLLWYKTIVPTYTPDYYYQYTIRATDLTVNANGVFITGKYYSSDYSTYDCNTQTGVILKTRSYKIANYNFTAGFADDGLFITKLNSSGTVVWNKTATIPLCYNNSAYGNNDNIESNPLITSDKNNNIITSFVISAPRIPSFSIGSDVIPLASSNAGNAYYLIAAKYNGAGTLQWSNYAGGGFSTGYDGNGYVIDCNSFITDNNGNIFFYGTTKDSTFFGSHLFRTAQPETDGSYAEATFLAKISALGTWQFVEEVSDRSTNFLNNAGGGGNPERLAIDNNNNVYASVTCLSNPNILFGDTTDRKTTSSYLVKLNNSGSLIWYKLFGSTVADNDASSLCFNNNSLYLSGYVATDNENLLFSNLFVPHATIGSYEYLTAKTDLNGNFIWANTFGADYSTEYGNAIKVSNGNIYTAGAYNYITTLGNLNSASNIQTSTYSLFFGKLKDQYIRLGAVTPATTCAGSNIIIPFTSYGLVFSSANTFTAELSDASGSFVSPVAIGSTVSTGTGSISATLPNTLTYGNTYIVRIKSSDTLKTGYNYYAYADTGYKITITCPPPVSLSTTNITATSAKFNWAATACGAKYKIQRRLKGVITWQNVTVAGSANSYIATGLTAGTAYQWRIATICQVSPQIISAYSPVQNFTTASSLLASNSFNNDLKEITVADLSATIIPNPVVSAAVVYIKGNKGEVTLILTDVSGKIIWKSAASDSRINIPMQNFAAGTYLLSVKDDNQSKVLKLVKAE